MTTSYMPSFSHRAGGIAARDMFDPFGDLPKETGASSKKRPLGGEAASTTSPEKSESSKRSKEGGAASSSGAGEGGEGKSTGAGGGVGDLGEALAKISKALGNTKKFSKAAALLTQLVQTELQEGEKALLFHDVSPGD